MNRRARAFLTSLLTFAFCACVLLVARSAYAATVDLNIDGSYAGANSISELQKKLDSAGGKNKNVTINLNGDLRGGPINLPKKTTITLNLNGYTIDRGLTSENSKGHTILVNKNSKVTINGGNLDVQKQVRAWTSGGTTILRTITARGLITGGYSTNKSGGIHLESGARLTLNNVTIAGCRAEQKGGSDGYGGGIWASGSDVTVSLNNSNISYNYAYNDGGGIAGTSSQFNLYMNNSRVGNNYAKRDGGGIALRGDKAVVTGDPQSFVSGNSCGDKYGGGVYINKDSVSVSGFTVESNTAKYGGGVATRDHSITLSSLTIRNNTAQYGGGVYVGDFTNVMSTATDSLGSCTITNNKTWDNTWGKGAGVYVVGSGRGWLVKSFSLEMGGKTIIKDNGNGSGNLVFGSTDVHPNFTLVGDSDVRMGYEKISEDAVQVTHDRLKGPNCIRYLTPENGGYHFTYNPSSTSRKIFYVKNGKDNTDKYGSEYGKRQTIGGISSTAAAPKVDASKSYNGYPVTRGYVRFPSVVEEKVDLATPFFYSDGYFFDDPETYNSHLATASLCMAMSGFYLNTGDTNAEGGYINKHASARQFMADIGCDDQKTYVNDFNVQKPGIDTIGVTISSKELKDKKGKGSGYYLIPVAIRGANYEAEWTSNVTLDKANNTDNAQASGFESAAKKVYREVRDYMRRNNIPAYKTKFWVSGYSRAGATTNLVCRYLIDYLSAPGAKVFGYPMEAPQGGTNKSLIDSQYHSIHNVINQADLVPLVAPTAMGFKRYGVDHYIPGTSAGAPYITENNAVTRGGSGGPAGRVLYADNTPYYSNSVLYNNAAAIKQLKAIDPNIVFDDYFATAGMDFFPSPSIYEKSTGKTTVYEEKFIKDFLNELQTAAISDRDYYANELEPTFRTVMGIVFGMEPSRARIFIDRASTTMNRFSTVVASWDDHSMLRIYYSLIGEWHKASDSKKKEYTDLFYKKLTETEALDVLTTDERAKFDAAWPKLFDFIMRVLDRDYNTKSYNTAKMMMLGTFAYNSSRIMANHYPEITLAWLRTYDSYYTNELIPVTIQNASAVSAPSASVDSTNLKAGADQNNQIPAGKKTVKLDVTNIKGEAIYYKASKGNTQISPNTCKNGYDIYRGGIDLGKVQKNDTFTITAYAMSYGTKSAEVTYKINASGALHEVVVRNEVNARRKKLSQTYTWAEGTTQRIEAKDNEDYLFDSWKVWDEQRRDVTTTVLGNDLKNKSVEFTMPTGGQDNFSENYKLTFEATFKWRPIEYPKHTYTVKVGDKTETFQVSEGSKFTYDATDKIPEGKYFTGWKVTDQTGTVVTSSIRPSTYNAGDPDYVWQYKNKPNMTCSVPCSNQDVKHRDGTKYTYAQDYSLTFEAQLQDVATVSKIGITGVGEAMLYGSKRATIDYYAGENNKVHSLNQYARWRYNQNKTKNEDTTVTTTTTYENILNCPKVEGRPFVADDDLTVSVEVQGDTVVAVKDSDTATVTPSRLGYTAKWNRKSDGTIRVIVTKVETKTTGTPTFTYNVTANACDANDADRNVLSEGDRVLTTGQVFKAGADGVFKFYNGPHPLDDNWYFVGYEAAADSGLQKVNPDNPRDNTFKVVDKDKNLTVNMLYIPEITKIDVSGFPQPVMGEPLAGADDEGIDLAYILPETSVFTDAFATQVKSLEWQPAPGEGGVAAGDTAYTAVLELECVKKDDSDAPYQCSYAQHGVAVATDAEHPCFESAAFDDKTGKLYLYFNKTARDNQHKVTVVDYCANAPGEEEKTPRNETWVEGEAKSITAKSYDDFVFSGWNVSNGTDDVITDALELTEADLKQSTLAFTMPGTDALGDRYELHFEANYVPKAQSLHTIITAPMEGATLANTAAIKWRATEESEQRSVEVPVAWSARIESGSGTGTETWTYTATMRLDAATAAEFVSGDITTTAGPSDELVHNGAEATCKRNADGSMTVSVVFAPIETAASAEEVTIEAYDANTKNALARVNPETLSVAWDTNDNGEFELLPPAIDGAAFVDWEIPEGSKVTRVGTTGNKFKFQNDATAGDNCSVHALYVPTVTSVTIEGVAAPVAGQQLATLNENVSASLGFSDATKTLFGENTLPGGTDTAARIKVTNLTWTPAASGNEADYETQYTAAATIEAKRVRIEDDQEIEEGNWRFVYASGVGVQAQGASATRLNAAANTANLYFPQTGRDKYHQVNINKSTYNMDGDEFVDSWHEGTTHTVVARGVDDKQFSEWTIVDQGGVNVADKLGLLEEDLKNETLQLTMPAYEESGGFAKDYSLTVTATYTDKLATVTANVPNPSLEAEQLPAKATLSWDENQSAEVDIWWEYEGQIEQSGENKTITDTYTAMMQLDADNAQKFASGVTVNATTGEGEPQIKANGVAWIWNPDGSATITVEFDPIVTNVEMRKIVAQACDINAEEQPKIEGTEDEVLTQFVDENDEPFAVYAPEVEGAEFVDWVVPEKVTQVDASELEGQDTTQGDTNTTDDDATVGFFKFADDAPAGATFTIKALYKPVVSEVIVTFDAPKGGQAMATTAEPTAASFALQNTNFSPLNVAVSELTWDPAAEQDGTAAYNKEYDATVTLAPENGKQFVYDDDVLADYEVPNEGDEDDAALVDFSTTDPAHTMYVSFYATGLPGLQGIVEPDPIVTENVKNNVDGLKALLPETVSIEVEGGTVNTASVEWQDPECIENGGKAFESEWYALGTITLPEGVGAPEDADLSVYISIYVMPAETLNLLSVEQPADITDVDPDADKTQQLPTTTTLTLEDGITEEVPVEWDEPVLVDDGILVADGEQVNDSVWTVTGRVTALPAGVTNTDNLSLELSLNIYVNPPDRQHEPVEAPYATLDDGIFDLSQVIYLDADDSDATIYYTTDSGAGLGDFVEYTRGTPIYLDRTTTDDNSMMVIQAYTTMENKDPSEVVSYLYMLDEAIEVPEGEELVFNGEEQTGVWSNDNYALLNPSEGARIDEYGDGVATNVGTYTVRAHIADKLQWQLETDEEGNVPTTTDDQTITFKIVPASVNDCDIELVSTVPYTGEALTPKPVVRLGDYVAVEGRDYKLEYKDNVNVGKAKVIITGIGNLKDSITCEFTVDGGDSLKVTYAGHAQNVGDLSAVSDGDTLGSAGKSRRIEAFSAKVEGGSIMYRAHVQDKGWEEDWTKDGDLCGTTGKAKRLEAVQMELSDALRAEGYHVWYRVHVQDFGWLGWTCDGAVAGTVSQSKRLEAVEVVVLRGDAKPKEYDAKLTAFRGFVTASAHVQNDGWQKYRSAGRIGTTGKSKRMEAMWITSYQIPGCGIQYQGHIQNKGWETEWYENGGISGTTGKSLRMEAVRIQLTGDAAQQYSLWYRVHSQDFGWSGWARDGQDAGSTGYGKRAEAVEMVVLSRDAAAPGSTKNALRSR